jgi:microcystin-dependent protein
MAARQRGSLQDDSQGIRLMYTFTPSTKIESAKINANFAELEASVLATPPVGLISPYGGSSAPSGWLLCDGSLTNRTTYNELFAIIGTTYGAGDGSTTFNVPDLRSRMPLGTGAGTFVTTFPHTDVNIGTEEITVPSNVSLFTGAAVVLSTTGTLPTGLSPSTTYYVIRMSATVIKLATTLALAVAGTAINLTAQGSGTNTITISFTDTALGVKGGEATHALTIGELAAHNHTLDQGTGATGSGNFSLPSPNAVYPANYASNNRGGSEAHNNLPPYLAVQYIIRHGA